MKGWLNKSEVERRARIAGAAHMRDVASAVGMRELHTVLFPFRYEQVWRHIFRDGISGKRNEVLYLRAFNDAARICSDEMVREHLTQETAHRAWNTLEEIRALEEHEP